MKVLDRKGQGVPGAVITVIVAVIMLAVGGIIISELFTSFDADLQAGDLSGSWNKTKTSTTTAFNLMPIVIILLGAATLIGAVFLFARKT